MRNQTTPAEGQAATIQRLMQVGIPISVLFSGAIFPLGVLLYWFTSNLWTMGQQFYIFKFHPHTPTGQVAAGPGNEVGKALAPKVGQKPTKGNRTAAVSMSKAEPEVVEPAARSSRHRWPARRRGRRIGVSARVATDPVRNALRARSGADTSGRRPRGSTRRAVRVLKIHPVRAKEFHDRDCIH